MTDASGRSTLHDAAGHPVASYLEAVREGRPWADQLRVAAPGAQSAVLAQLSGWYVSVDPDFGRALISAGAQMARYAHSMLADLVAQPPPDWSDPVLPSGIALTP